MTPDSSNSNPLEIDIIVEAQVRKTESKDKVADAVSKLFHGHGELRIEDDKVQFVSEDIQSLKFLRDQFRDRRIRAAARRLLLTGMKNESNQTYLLFSKQAATVGIAALCDDPRESQLGPIILRIRSENMEKAIDWITSGYSSAERS